MTVGPVGSLYFADTRNHRIRKITPEGIITTVAGTGFQGYSGDGGLAVEAQLSRPAGNAFDPAGNLVFADMGNHVIRAILADGTISTISGNGASVGTSELHWKRHSTPLRTSPLMVWATSSLRTR